MAPFILSALAVVTPFLVSAYDIGAVHHIARQEIDSAVSSSVGEATSSSASGSVSVTLPVPAGPPATYSFSLQATNPTAIPLTVISANQATFATHPLDSTASAGATPTFIPNAPSLPDASLILPSNYPTWDIPPPVDSPEVQQWKNEVANSGISIPDLNLTLPGGCAANPGIASDPNRCWWTCTGCTRPEDITECPNPMQWGLTYDDGPGFYTSNLLRYLDEKKLKSTFFVVGSRAIQFPRILQAQFMDEHQIAVHTWSHTPLTTQTNDEIIAELGWTKKIIKDVLGLTPNMMRPPFGDIDDRVRAISVAMGLTPVIWTRTSPISTFDTDDFNIHNGVTPVSKVLQNWQSILASASTLDHGFIVLEHDLFQESVEVATGYILPDALAHNPPFHIQPVVQCLGRNISDAYIETNSNKTNLPTSTTGGNNAQNGDDSGAGGVQQFRMQSARIGALALGFCGLMLGLFAALRL